MWAKARAVGNVCASEVDCTLATTCHWVTQSTTALMWCGPLMPSSAPWWTLSMRMPVVLPSGLQRIRHYGLLANRTRVAKLQRCRELMRRVAAATRA
jgi:hypothetical protein